MINYCCFGIERAKEVVKMVIMENIRDVFEMRLVGGAGVLDPERIHKFRSVK